MPREITTSLDNGDMVASVNWRNDAGDGTGYVQIATVNRASTARLPVAVDNGSDGSTTYDNGEILDGWHVMLDRDGVNRLIRTLRRARDHAYGADA